MNVIRRQTDPRSRSWGGGATPGRILWASILGCALVWPVPSAVADDLKADILTRVKHAAVMVFTARSVNEKGDTPFASGSGYFINNNGLMLTNNHVVDPGHGKLPFEKFKAAYEGGRLVFSAIIDTGTDNEKTYEALSLYQNESADLALLQVVDTDGSKLKTPNFLRFPPGDRLRKEMKVWTIGWPGGDRQATVRDKHPEATVTAGNVTGVPMSAGGRIRKVFTSAPARPGNSGGPCVDEDGFLVGTVTLLQNADDREDTGGANYSALSPARLAGQFVRYAYLLQKMPKGTDFSPFMELLTQADGCVNIPEFSRLPDQDVLIFPDGDRLHGTIASEFITWNSALGEQKIPLSACAYMMHTEEGSQLFLEGGNRIGGTKSGQKFQFKSSGGETTSYGFDEVSVIAFRKSDRKLAPVPEKLLVLDTDVTRLQLGDITGVVKFESKGRKVDVPLDRIFRMERQGDGQMSLLLTDDQKMTGKFVEGTYQARVSPTDTALPLKLDGVSRGFVAVESRRAGALPGLDLSEALAQADADIQTIARKLDEGELVEARKNIDGLLKGENAKRLSETRKEQLTALDALCLLKEGQYAAAQKVFAKIKDLKKDELVNIGVFAAGCDVLLKKYADGQYKGKPLKDPVVLAEAGAGLARERADQLRDWLKDAKDLGVKKGEYKSAVRKARDFEELMNQTAVFRGPGADVDLLRVWKAGRDIAGREFVRIAEILGQDLSSIGSRNDLNNLTAGGSASQKMTDKEIKDLLAQQQEALKTAYEFYNRPGDYGFIINDPDAESLIDG